MADPISISGCLFSLGMSMLVKMLKKKCLCNKIVGIVVPSKSGTTQLVNSLNLTDESIVLDLSENIKLTLNEKELEMFNTINRQSPSYMIHILPLYKRYFEQIKKDFKGRRIILVSSNSKELEYCGIAKKLIHSFVPNSEFTKIIADNLPEEQRAMFEASRLELLLNAKERQRSVFKSFDDLKEKIVAKYKLSVKI
jgi:hypothetical protein